MSWVQWRCSRRNRRASRPGAAPRQETMSRGAHEDGKTRKLFDFGWKKHHNIPTNTPTAAESSKPMSEHPVVVPIIVLYACICGEVVEADARIKDSDTAMQCGYDRCETSWVCYRHFSSVSCVLLTNLRLGTVSFSVLQLQLPSEEMAVRNPWTHPKTCTYGLKCH